MNENFKISTDEIDRIKVLNQEEKKFHALIYVLLGAIGLEKLKAHAKT